MARKLRVQYRGAIYHILNRGDHRELIFRDDADRQWFLDTLGEACVKTAWQVHAYYLQAPSRRPVWLRVDRLLGDTGIPKDSAAGRRQFEWRLEERRQQEVPTEAWQPIQPNAARAIR
jgi:hypothetical protein